MGMSAGEVRQLIGKPEVVEKFAYQNQPAECWLYRRTVSQDQHSVVASQRATTVADEGCMTQPTQYLPIYAFAHARLEQVTLLYVVDDHLVASKQWQERSVRREGY